MPPLVNMSSTAEKPSSAGQVRIVVDASASAGILKPYIVATDFCVFTEYINLFAIKSHRSLLLTQFLSPLYNLICTADRSNLSFQPNGHISTELTAQRTIHTFKYTSLQPSHPRLLTRTFPWVFIDKANVISCRFIRSVPGYVPHRWAKFGGSGGVLYDRPERCPRAELRG